MKIGFGFDCWLWSKTAPKIQQAFPESESEMENTLDLKMKVPHCPPPPPDHKKRRGMKIEKVAPRWKPQWILNLLQRIYSRAG